MKEQALISKDELQARRARQEREGDIVKRRPKSSPGMECASCAGRGRTGCTLCNATGLENNWLFQPKKEGGGWGPRGVLLEADDGK